MEFASIGGIALHYNHAGGGIERPLLVFVNSLGTDFRIWNHVTPHFLDYSVLTYDKRGHGLSDLGSPPYTIEDHVNDLAGLIDHAGASGAVICGLSVGGLIAQGLAAARPDLVRGLILCDTAHKIGTAAFWNARIDAVEREGLASIADPILERWFTPAFRANRPDELAGCRNMLTRQPAAGYAGTCAAIRDADHTDLVSGIRAPTLCIVGDQDGSTPPELVRNMAELIPGAEFAVIPEAGHIPCIEQTAAFVALLRGFLDTHGGRA